MEGFLSLTSGRSVIFSYESMIFVLCKSVRCLCTCERNDSSHLPHICKDFLSNVDYSSHTNMASEYCVIHDAAYIDVICCQEKNICRLARIFFPLLIIDKYFPTYNLILTFYFRNWTYWFPCSNSVMVKLHSW